MQPVLILAREADRSPTLRQKCRNDHPSHTHTFRRSGTLHSLDLEFTLQTLHPPNLQVMTNTERCAIGHASEGFDFGRKLAECKFVAIIKEKATKIKLDTPCTAGARSLNFFEIRLGISPKT